MQVDHPYRPPHCKVPHRVKSALGRREWTRSGLAFAFVIIFGVTIIFAFFKVGTYDWAQTKDLLQILLPAETGLLGSALGFYFGARSNER